MSLDDRMPPDPFAEDGIDLFELETAERLAHDGVAPSDPRWDHLEGPSIEEFDEAARELAGEEILAEEQMGHLIVRTALAGIAVLVAIGLVVLLLR